MLKDMQIMNKHLFKIILLIAMFGINIQAIAQPDEEDSEIQSIESDLEKNIPQARPEEVNVETVFRKERESVNLEGAQQAGPEQLVIIQKTYMPKTGRFSFSGGLTLFPSDVFFKTAGLQVRSSYHFNETWGMEAVGTFFSSTKSNELKDLESKQDVTAQNITTLKNYLGANVYFNSMYGKYALNNKKIIPFEIYQTLGIGQVQTDQFSSTALSAGLGQILSLSRNHGLRVDLNVIFYQSQNLAGDKQSANAFLITFAYTTFFPKAPTRW
jgi:outer membrane beta-barrel protein